MSDQEKSPHERAEQAVDLLIFAPIGAAMYIKDMIPMILNMFSERGRVQVEQSQTSARNIVTLVKSLGQARINQAQQDVQKRSSDVREAADRGLRIVQGFGRTAGTSPAPPSGARPAGAVDEATSGNGHGSAPGQGAEQSTPGVESTVPPDLAIPDYDSLSATQVAARLIGLNPDELEAVRGYEISNRGRKTIVGRIDSLLGK